ncbi:MAG: glycosyltransferase family 2 protein [Janthinobacterium lividum]
MVWCVVVNWNGWRDTLVCLRTLASQSLQPLHVVVVDNGSTDDSIEQLGAWMKTAESSPTTFSLLPSGANLGFARGSNLGVRQALEAGAEFVWLLNNDTECPPDTLAKLVQTARNGLSTGMVGTVLYYQSNPAKVQAWGGGRIHCGSGTATHYLRPTVLESNSYLTFASVLIRTAVFQEIGLLHEGFFMYYEDSDFCLRVRKTEWKLAVAADTAVLHKESASTEGTRNPFMEKTTASSGMRFLSRHSSLPWLSIPLFLMLKLGNRARRAEWAAFRAVLSGAADYFRR